MNIENPLTQKNINELADLELADRLEKEKIINFDKYNDARMQSQERSIIADVLELLKNKNRAVELGSGAMREVKQLVNAGFEEVVAIDYNEPKQKWIEDIDKEIVKFVKTSIENYEFSVEKNDLVSAFYVLPFVQKEILPNIMQKIQKSLKKEGVFIGTFFGPEDVKVKSGFVNGFTEDEIINMLRDMQIIGDVKKFKGLTERQGKKELEQTFCIVAQKI